MTVTINGTTGVTAPEVTLDNSSADGGQVVLKSSGYSNWNVDNYSGKFRAYYDTTEQLSITNAGLLQFNSGYGSVATAYGCRAWVNFNGTGTVAIRASGNVSSVTDNGTGNYTVNFAASMPDASYSVVSQARNEGVANALVFSANIYSTSSVSITAVVQSGSYVDSNFCNVSIFR